MSDVKKLIVGDENRYSPTDSKLETTTQSIVFYDDIFEEDEANDFFKTTKQHYEDTQEYERTHKKR